MTTDRGPRARRPVKRHGEELRLVLTSSLAPAARVLLNVLTSRIAAGAFAGSLFTGAALLVGGAVWGAIVRAAPCGEPPPLVGAFFGAFFVPVAFGWWAVPAGAFVGAALGALRLLRQKQSGAGQREAPPA